MTYPYSTSTGRIPEILDKIQTVGQPSKVDKTWFSSIGFTKQSDQRMIAVLKFIGFIESNGVPTDKWTKFRSKKSGKKILGEALKDAYNELYSIYPDAHEIDKEELIHFFSTRTTAGKLALAHTVNTFKNMADYAEFDGISTQKSIPEEEKPIDSTELEVEDSSYKRTSNNFSKQIESIKSGITINLNIQLSVPETTDEKVYDKFFEALKKHLLS